MAKTKSERYKCNIDPSFYHALNRVGLGMHIRDEKDRFLLAKRVVGSTPLCGFGGGLGLVIDAQVGS